MYIGLHVKYPLILSYFNETWFFSGIFSRNPKLSNLIKIRPVGEELLHADSQPDKQAEMTKLIVAFRSSA
jgi:hypothetical protein